MKVDFVVVFKKIGEMFMIQKTLNISKSNLCNSAAAFLEGHLWMASFSQFLGTVRLYFAVSAVSEVACWLDNRSSYVFLKKTGQ